MDLFLCVFLLLLVALVFAACISSPESRVEDLMYGPAEGVCYDPKVVSVLRERFEGRRERPIQIESYTNLLK